MECNSSMSSTKRLGATPFNIPTSTSAPLHSSDFNRDSLPRSASDEFIFKPKKRGVKSRLSLYPPITLSEKSEIKPYASPASRQRSIYASVWSPSFFRNLRWRPRRYTMWDGLVFCSFVVAMIVFFSALLGVGYVPEEPNPSRSTLEWHVPELEVVVREKGQGNSASGLLEDFLEIFGFASREPIKIEEEVDLEGEEEDDVFEQMSPRSPGFGRDRPVFGAWNRPQRRMITVHEPSIYPPHAGHDHRRRNRLPWIESPPFFPFHGPFYRRLLELTASTEMTQHASSEDEEGGEPLWGLDDEKDIVEDVSFEEDAEV